MWEKVRVGKGLEMRLKTIPANCTVIFVSTCFKDPPPCVYFQVK